MHTIHDDGGFEEKRRRCEDMITAEWHFEVKPRRRGSGSQTHRDVRSQFVEVRNQTPGGGNIEGLLSVFRF
jgi:hypothetical protein